MISNCKDLLNCNELNGEEKLKIRTVDTNIVQKMVGEFKEEFPGSEQWIDVTIDLLDVKKIMKSYKDKSLAKQLEKQLNQRRNILQVYRARNKIEQNQNNDLRNQSELEIQKVMKRIKLSGLSNEDKSSDNIDSLVDLVAKEQVSNKSENVLAKELSAGKKNREDNKITDIIKSKLDNGTDESGCDEESDFDDQRENESAAEKHSNDGDESDELAVETADESDNEPAGQFDNESDEVDEKPNSEMNETTSTEQIENNSEYDEEVPYESSNEDNCSIDSYQFDRYVDESAQQEYLQSKPDSGDEEDILIEDCEYESSEEEEGEPAEGDLQENELKKDSESATVDLQSAANPVVDVEKASEDYLKKQLVKAFGEKIANRSSNKDVSSDEEWDDDFFINKKVKKFKPTVVDLERYKDLEAKEKGTQNKEGEANEQDEGEEEETKTAGPKKFKKKFVKKVK